MTLHGWKRELGGQSLQMRESVDISDMTDLQRLRNGLELMLKAWQDTLIKDIKLFA